MRCKQVEQLFTDYFDHTLPLTMQQEMEAHLAACPECAREARSLQEVNHILGLRESLEPPRDLWASLNARIAQEKPLPPSSWPLWRAPALAAGALAAAGLAGWLFLALLKPNPGAMVNAPPLAETRIAITFPSQTTDDNKGQPGPAPAVKPSKKHLKPKLLKPRTLRQHGHRPNRYRTFVLVQKQDARPRSGSLMLARAAQEKPAARARVAMADLSALRLTEAINKDPRWIEAFREAFVKGTKEIVQEEATTRLLSVASQMQSLKRQFTTSFIPVSPSGSPE